jgi:hypothetical protein
MKPDCHIYAGRLDTNGYGKVGGGELVSRIVLAQKLGRPIRPGYCALHRCDYPPCINEDHLWEGTHAENMADCAAKERIANGRAHSKTMQEKAARGNANGSRKHPEMVPRGERHHWAKLTRQDVVDIRTALTSGTSCRSTGSPVYGKAVYSICHKGAEDLEACVIVVAAAATARTARRWRMAAAHPAGAC